jgi:hypothetical protein
MFRVSFQVSVWEADGYVGCFNCRGLAGVLLNISLLLCSGQLGDGTRRLRGDRRI